MKTTLLRPTVSALRKNRCHGLRQLAFALVGFILLPTGGSAQPTNCVAPPAGLVLWLPFDEGIGTNTANLASSVNPGVLTNQPAHSPGYVRDCLCFSGSANQYVYVPDYPGIDPGTGDFTLDAWIKGSFNGAPAIIVDKRNATTGIGYSFRTHNNNLELKLSDGGASTYTDTDMLPTDNQWHFVAVTVQRASSTGGRFYVDGVPTSSFNPIAHEGSLNNTNAFRVANSPVDGNPWSGCIDEVEVFLRALQTNEIQGIYQAGFFGKCKPALVMSNCPPAIASYPCLSAVPAPPTVTASTWCESGALVNYNETQSNPGSSCSNVITRTWSASDSCGNFADCVQTITVNNTNTTPPVITCASNKTAYYGTSWSFDTPTATDNCGGTNVTITILDTVTNGQCPQLITQTWLATDCAGNTNTCGQTVTVINTNPPVIICPSDLVLVSCTSTPAFYTATASSAFCSNVTVVFTPPSGSLFTPGSTNTVQCEAADCCGNSNSCNFTVTVQVPSLYTFTTLAGLAGSSGTNDGTGSAARFNNPASVAVDSAGNVYVADQNNHTIRKVTPAGVVTTLAGRGGSRGSADGTGSAARFAQPSGVTVDSAGNVFVADTDNDTIREVTPLGVVTTLAGLVNNSGSADGTGSAARFDAPWGVAVDSADNVFVGDWLNNTIRQVTSAGVVTTPAGLAGSSGNNDGTGSAARFNEPLGVAVDNAGNVYVADNANDAIRKMTGAGVVTTLAGGSAGSADGTGSAARFSFPSGVAVDSAGNLYVADYNNSTIRRVTASGVVTTIGGLAMHGGSADGTGSAARFLGPYGVAVDGQGNLYVADFFNNTIRKGVPTSNSLLITCSTDKTVVCGTNWSFDPPTAVSACCTNVTITVLSTVTNGICPQVITRTWQASDCGTNSSTCSQTVTVINTNPPVIFCPSNIVVSSSTGAVVNFTVSATSVCCANVAVVCTPASGSLFGPGTTTVNCTATDCCSNTATCSFAVTVTPVSYLINIQAGFNLIANQLDHGSNTLNEIMPLVPDGSVFFKYNNSTGTWTSASYSAALGSWAPSTLTLNPGEGAFFQSPTNFTLTFTGNPHVPVLPVAIPSGSVYLLSRQTNDIGNYTNIVGKPPTNGATVYQWGGSNYNTFTFNAGAWTPSEPTVAVGQAVWISPDPTNAPPPSPSFYSVSIQAGSNLIANQLDHGSNTLNELMALVPDGSVFFKYNNSSGTWSSAAYSAANGSWAPNVVDDPSDSSGAIALNPGEGGFFQSPTNFTLTFTGNPHVPVLPVTIPSGTAYLLSRQTNDIGNYTNIVGKPPTNGATVYQWGGSNYNTFTFNAGAWTPSEPTVAVGQAVWISPDPTNAPPPSPSFYSVSIQPGLNLIANQLDHGGPPLGNTLNEIMPLVPDGSVLFKYNNSSGTWTSASYSAALGSWAPNTLTLSPGEGVFFQSPTNFTLTFTGNPHVPVLPVAIPTGSVYLLSRQTNDVGTYDNTVGEPPTDGATVYEWGGSNYSTFTFNSGAWIPSAPTVAVGQAVWISPDPNNPPPPSPSFYSVSIQPGLNLIANQLDHGGPPLGNTLNEIMPLVPDGSVLFKYNNSAGTWTSASYSAALGSWAPSTLTLSPGEGAFFQTPTNFTLTFTGNPHVPVLPVTIPSGACYLLSRQTNDIGNYTNIVGLPATNHAQVFLWNGSAYMVYSHIAGVWNAGDPEVGPTVPVGAAAWIAPNGGSPPPLPTSYTINIQAGFNLIANQLDHGSNTLNEIMPLVPDGSVFFKYNNSAGTWTSASYSAALGSWAPSTLTLSPGEGAFFQAPTNFTLTFTGNPNVPVLPVAIPNGASYLLSRQTNDIGNYTNIVGKPPTNFATVYQWGGSNYNTFTFNAGAWTPSEPTVAVGQAVWISPDPTNAPPPLPSSYSVSIGPGNNLLGNPFNAASAGSVILNLAPLNDVYSTPPGDINAFYILTWNGSNFVTAAYYENDFTADNTGDIITNGWATDASGAVQATPPILYPGCAFFLDVIGEGTNIVFGELPYTIALPGCFSGCGSLSFVSVSGTNAGTFQSLTGFTPEQGDELLNWNGSGYTTNAFLSGAWTGGTPVINPAEGYGVFIPCSSSVLSYPINIQAGFNLIANQLDHGSNTLNEIMPGVPDGCVLSKYDNASGNWSWAAYNASSNAWIPANLTLSPGEGAFLLSPTNFTLTLTGNPHVPVLPVAIPNGSVYLLSRQTNDTGTWTNIVGVAPSNGASVYQWGGSNYNTFTFAGGNWSPSEPIAAVGEALWISAPDGFAPPPLPVGGLHNRGLDYMAAHDPLPTSNTRLTFDQFLSLVNTVSNYLAGTGFNSSDIAGAVSGYLQANTNLNMFYSDGGQVFYGSPVPSDQWPVYVISNVVAQGAMSVRLGNQLAYIYGLVTNGTDPSAVLAVVTNLPNWTNWTASEQSQVSSFVSIYEASDSYWQTHTNNTPFKFKGFWHDFADAVGGLVGTLVGGALGGPVAGAVGECIGTIVASALVQDSDVAVIMPAPGIIFTQPASTLLYDGQLNQRQGAAVLDQQLGNLVCEPLSNGLPFALSVPLNGAQGFEAHWLPLESDNSLPIGAYVNSQLYGTAGSVSNGLLGSWQFTKTSTSNYVVTADFSPVGAATVTLQLYNGTTLVAQTNGQSGSLVVLNGGNGCVADDHWGKPLPPDPQGNPQPLGGSLTLFGPGNGPAPPVNVIFQGGWTAQGDRLVILPEGGPLEVSLSQAQLVAGGIPQILIYSESEDVSYAGMNASSIGNASLLTQSNQLAISGIGSSGQDGVQIWFPGGITQWAAEWEPLDPTPTAIPVGAYLQVQLVGTANSVINGVLATLIATKGTSNSVVSADFSPIATNLTVQVYSGPNLTGQVDGLAMGIIYSDKRLPGPNMPSDCSACCSYRCDTFDFTYNSTQTITIANGPTFTGDRVVIIPQGPPLLGSVSSLILEASQIPSIVITNEVVSPVVLSATATHNSLNITWSGTGVLQHSTDLMTWTDVTNAVSPYVVPIGSSNAFYRIRQPMGGESF